MSILSDLQIAIADLKAAALTSFGQEVTFTPQDRSGDQQIMATPMRTAIMDDYTPGFGANYTRLWIADFAVISPRPRKGDSITFGGFVYTIGEVLAYLDGAELRMVLN